MPGYTRSLKKGDTAAARRVIAGATAVNNAPTVSGDQMVSIGRYTSIDLIARCTGNNGLADGTYKFKVWWWYEAAEQWVLDATIGTVTMTTTGGNVVRALLNSPNYRCANGLYVEVSDFANNGTANVWIAGRDLEG